MFHILGIDPGNSGAIALVNSEKQLISVWDMPTVPAGKRNQISAPLFTNILAEVIQVNLSRDIPICYLEKVGAMPTDGAVQAFAFGRGVGIVEGCLAAAGISVDRVAPNVWKAQMGLTGRNKDSSRAKVLEHYPGWAETFKRKKDDGRAEAVLIALWGLRRELRDARAETQTCGPAQSMYRENGNGA